MHWWQGSSGSWYIHTIYPINSVLDFKACNYIFARPRFDGTREPFYIGQSGEFDQRLARHEKLGAAIRLGATEVHIHFLARSQQERLDIETDLRRGHVTPLNAQPTPALPFLPSLPLPAKPALAGLFEQSAPSNSQKLSDALAGLNPKPVPFDSQSLAAALSSLNPKPDPSVPLGALAGVNLKPSTSGSLLSLADLGMVIK